MFDFLGKHPRSPRNARLAFLATVGLAVLLAAIAVQLYVGGARALGILFGLIALVGVVVNTLRMMRSR
jgi:hypothetical protein